MSHVSPAYDQGLKESADPPVPRLSQSTREQLTSNNVLVCTLLDLFGGRQDSLNSGGQINWLYNNLK